jgi:hypothetical protein
MTGAIIGWIVVGLLALSGIAAGFWGMRQSTRSAARVLGMPQTPPQAVFVGWALTATVTVGWPLARLELLEWGIRLGASARPLALLPLSIPTWEARYEELATVRSVRGILSSGLRFAVAGKSDAVVFWSFQLLEILDRLETAGAMVDRSPVPLRQAGGIYKTW